MATIRNQTAILKNLADKLQDYFGGDERVADHFWHGINLSGQVDYALQQDIFQGLKDLGQAAKAAQEIFPNLDAYGFEEDAFANYRKVSADIGAFTEEDFLNAHLFDEIFSDNLADILAQTIKRIQNLKFQIESFSRMLEIHSVERVQVENLTQRLPINEINLPDSISLEQLQDNLEAINNAVANFEETLPLFKEGAEYLNI